MCTDPDLVAYSLFHDMAMDLFLHNESLQEKALERYYKVGSFFSPFSHQSLHAMQYLLEAKMTYCYGLFRSSIFCCAAVVDAELKRCAIQLLPQSKKEIESQTFGQTIAMLRKNNATPETLSCIFDELDWINRIRNEVSVHSYSKEMRSLFSDDDTTYDLNKLKQFFDAKEIEDIQRQYSEGEIDWLEQLTLKLLNTTKYVISNTFIYENSNSR